MSNIKIEDIGKDISLTSIEIIMRDQKAETIHDPEFNIIVIPHPTDCTHWVSVIRREVVLCITLIVLVLKPHLYS